MVIRWGKRLLLIMPLMTIILLFSSCKKNEVQVTGGNEIKIEYKLMTSKKDSALYFTRDYLGLEIGEVFPVAVKNDIVFVCDGYEGLTNNLVINLINLTYKRPISVIVESSNLDVANNTLLQVLPTGSEVIPRNETKETEYGLGHPPVLYYLEKNIVDKKYSHFMPQDWKSIEEFLSCNGEYSNPQPVGVGELFPTLSLTDEKKEMVTMENTDSKILLTLSPDCSICVDVATWILKQQWPIKPCIIINIRGEHLLEALHELDDQFSEIEISQESYEQVKEGQLIYHERVNGLLNILSPHFNVYLDSNNEVERSLNVYQHPCMILVNHDNIIVEMLSLVLVNSTSASQKDYIEPMQLVAKVFH